MISHKHLISLTLAATLLSGCVVADGVGSAGFHGHHPAGEMHREHFDMQRAGENRMQEHRQRMEDSQALERRIIERNREQMGQRTRQFERNERREQRFGYEEHTSERGGYSRISVPSPWRD